MKKIQKQRSCKKSSSKEDMQLRHKYKMAFKAERRDRWHKETPEPLVLANISQHHQDYGMTAKGYESFKGIVEKSS